VRVLSVLAVNTQVARAIIRKPHVALWPKRLDTPALHNQSSDQHVFLFVYTTEEELRFKNCEC